MQNFRSGDLEIWEKEPFHSVGSSLTCQKLLFHTPPLIEPFKRPETSLLHIILADFLCIELSIMFMGESDFGEVEEIKVISKFGKPPAFSCSSAHRLRAI